jgi:predicted NodU family carbamoyl transferase
VLGAALDARQRVRIQPLAEGQAPALRDLLELHYEQTGVPALIETGLNDDGRPAQTARDAVRAMYSSAIDALFIGNFILMKDHWLLRSHAG